MAIDLDSHRSKLTDYFTPQVCLAPEDLDMTFSEDNLHTK